MDRQALDYATDGPPSRDRATLRAGLLLALIVTGALLGVRSFAVFYEIADQEPFYAFPPAQIRQMMRLPIYLECLWLLWALVVVACVWAKWLGRWHSLILIWAVFWMMCLWSGISQYASDIAVLEGPNREWYLQNGKHARPPPSRKLGE